MTIKVERPISPHLGVYRLGIHMMTSITHRITGFILGTAGMLTLLWWLSAIGGGAESYATFQSYVVSAPDNAEGFEVYFNWFFRLLGIVVIFSFFQHFFSGIRHLVMDMGAGFELKSNNMTAWLVFIAALTATVVTVVSFSMNLLGA